MEARPYNEAFVMDVADHADIEHETSIDTRLSRLEQALALNNHIKRLEARIGAMRSEMLDLLEDN
jgi:hypothetical protein